MINGRASNFRQGSAFGQRPEHVFVPLTLLDFKELWRTHFRVEILSEELRRRLEKNPIFNLVEAFDILDVRKQGEVTVDDLKTLIQQRGFFVTQKEALSLMAKFDKGNR